MKVSTKGRYAIRVMLDLALNNTGEYIPLKEVAERQGITLKYLEQISYYLSVQDISRVREVTVVDISWLRSLKIIRLETLLELQRVA